jgi:ubiquinone/menaquinone biosynthesis C-methylase UbiE
MDKSKFAVLTYNKIADIYSKQYFGDLTDTPYIDKFISLLPQNAKVLDVGCGPGQFTKYMIGKGLKVEGIDLSEKMLEIAKSYVPNGKFKLMDMRKLLYKANTFDGLLAAYSLIHIPSKEISDTLKGFRKILKDKGYMLLITQKGKPDKIVPEPLKQGEKIFINYFTKSRLNKYLTTSGFFRRAQDEVKTNDPGSISNKIIYTIAQRIDTK